MRFSGGGGSRRRAGQAHRSAIRPKALGIPIHMASDSFDRDSFDTDMAAEFRRIGLDLHPFHGLAIKGVPSLWLARLRALPVGSSWTDVFPGMPEGWTPNETSKPERALGPFDYRSPPFGIAVFACLDEGAPVSAGEAAIERARALGYPIYGAGVVVDRGHPHLYIVLTLE